MFFKSPITQHPQIGKFQKWTEMKVNYPTNEENIQMDFSDNFHNIKKFVQLDHFKKKNEKLPNFFFMPLPKNRRWSEKISIWQK
jgi:hypothetical protein